MLVDTSVWVDHFRSKEPWLAAALEDGRVMMHPFVVGELACGNLKNRSEVLKLLGDLPVAPIATDNEVLDFIERRSLMGMSIGYIDVHLLADGTRLWTRDKRLADGAKELDVAFQETE